MDPSTQAAQDVQNQTSAAQPTGTASDQSGQSQVTSAQPTASTQAPPVPTPPKTQISVSGGGGLEAGSAVIMQEDSDTGEDDEEALKVAPLETKNRTSMGQGSEDEQPEEQQIVSKVGVVDVQEADEMQPSVTEVAISSPEVEKIIEITPPEEPKITQELKAIGITHSGPGIIDVSQTNFAPKPMPVTYEQALTEEEKIKENRLHNSKFWLLEKIKYLWRKINPNIEMTVKKQTAQKPVPAKPNTVTANQVPVKKELNVEIED